METQGEYAQWVVDTCASTSQGDFKKLAAWLKERGVAAGVATGVIATRGEGAAEPGGIEGIDGGGEVWTTLYEGRASIVAGGSSPFYGGGMKLFPFARARPDLMHMRIAAISPFRFVPNVWGIFR